MSRPLRIGHESANRRRKGSIAVVAGASFTVLIGLAAVSKPVHRMAKLAQAQHHGFAQLGIVFDHEQTHG